jgi:hypothetical protein
MMKKSAIWDTTSSCWAADRRWRFPILQRDVTLRCRCLENWWFYPGTASSFQQYWQDNLRTLDLESQLHVWNQLKDQWTETVSSILLLQSRHISGRKPWPRDQRCFRHWRTTWIFTVMNPIFVGSSCHNLCGECFDSTLKPEALFAVGSFS